MDRVSDLENLNAAQGQRELSLRAVLLGLILSVVMGAANVYLGLKAGMTVSASIPAAVVAMLILRGVFKNGTILEANQVQTAASAGESLAAGIIFTMPAMIMIGVWQEFDIIMTAAIAFTGGLLGILFMIPMRKVFVTDNKELPYPEGVACATVLQAGTEHEAEEKSSAMSVVSGALFGAVFKFLASFLGMFNGTLEGAIKVADKIFYFGGDVSPALVAVGFIVRFKIAILVFFGGVIAWLIGIPLLGLPQGFSGIALDGAWELWSTKIRYLGVGAMAVGGVVSIISVRSGLVHAVEELKKHLLGTAAKNVADHERDIPTKAIITLLCIAVSLVAVIYFIFTKSASITLLSTVIMVIMAFFFTAVASYIVGLVGGSNSPVSGMTITVVLFTGAMLYIFGFAGTQGMVATLGVAAIVCCVACTSGDVCNDLKTGHIVGASPYKQQIMQIAGVAVAAFVMAPVMQLLHENTPGGIGGRELPAPQAGLFASLAQGFFGEGQLPWNMISLGVGVGIAIFAIDEILKKRKSNFRLHVMPVAVGMYLPFGVVMPMVIGGLVASLIDRGSKGKKTILQRGVLYSSGLIAGESLMGVGVAALVALGFSRVNFGFSPSTLTWFTFLAVIVLVVKFVLSTRPKKGDL